ncbi:MAG TPA: deoxyhypusine synthase, partial [Ferroplasma sp.]|nr:deoxyhypusine synthase [Ferroplasma sp.]
MEIKREDLLKNPVKDMKINKNTTLMQLMEMFGTSGGFTSKKVF